MDEDQTIRDFLGDRPDSTQLQDWRETLEARLKKLVEEQQKGLSGAAAGMETKIVQLRRQVEALREEEAITRFVEDSVRVTLAMGAATEGMDDIEE
jgi:hypothetical protein